MGSTFFGLTIAGSGLNAFNASINTTANNVSNVETEGYSRQKTNLEASSALRVWQKYGSTSTGVLAASTTRSRDEYYDVKYRNNESDYGLYEKKYYYMKQIEDYFNDKGEVNPGYSTIFAEMFNSLEAVQTAAGDLSKRNEFLSGAQKLVTYFNNTATQLENLQKSINDEVKTTVDTVNAIAEKITILNKQINTIEMEGGQANDLRDKRDTLVDDLSQIMKITVEEDKVTNSNYPDMYTGATTYKIKVNGKLLVDTYYYNQMACVTRENKYNQSDADGLYDVIWKDSEMSVNVTAKNQTGVLKALFEMRDGNDRTNIRGTFTAVDPWTGERPDSTVAVLTSPSSEKVEGMSLPPSGVFYMNNTAFTYSSFTAELEQQTIEVKQYKYDDNGEIELDDDFNPVFEDEMKKITVPVLYDHDGFVIPYDEVGNPAKSGGEPRIESYRFVLTDPITETTRSLCDGMQATVGSTIDCKGVPYYQEQINEFVRTFAKMFNDIHNTGEDLNGNAGESLFVATNPQNGNEMHFDDMRTGENDGVTKSYQIYDDASRSYVSGLRIGTIEDDANNVITDSYYLLTAKNISLNRSIMRDVNKFAATTNIQNGVDNNDLVGNMAALESTVKMFRGGTADKFLQCIYADVTVDAQEAKVFSENYKNIEVQIQKQRDSVSGVDEDEEAMNLVKFQNAYNLSSKIISVMAEMYDQLILHTGV